MISTLARYFITAGFAALVDLAGFWVLLRCSGWVVVSAMASWFIAALVNYALTSRFVFKRKPALRDSVRFVAGASFGFAVNISVTTGCSIELGLYPPLAKIAGIAVAFGINFAINALWVFHPRRFRNDVAERAKTPDTDRIIHS